jgi:hypothetical protein
VRAVSEFPTTPSETILFVEDEALVRMDMAQFLRGCGYHVYEAATAKEAIKALQAKFVVDLVFTDINLPVDFERAARREGSCYNRGCVKDGRHSPNHGTHLGQAIHGPRFARPGTTGADEAMS